MEVKTIKCYFMGKRCEADFITLTNYRDFDFAAKVQGDRKALIASAEANNSN